MKYPLALQPVIDRLSKFPTVGPKTAERFAFYLLSQSPDELVSLAEELKSLHRNLTKCGNCYAIAACNPCPICSDLARNCEILCVVSETRDLIAIENSGQFKGLYHVLNGSINVLSSENLTSLTIKPLLQRLKSGTFKEVILAMNPDVSGETTALYIAKLLSGSGIAVSRLARGLPAGAVLDYADPMTLSHALNFRQKIK